MKVYADNASTTKMNENSINAMTDVLKNIYGNASSLHSIGQTASTVLDNCRERIALSLGCQPKEIYFTSGGSEADNQAIVSAATIGKAKNKMHIISSKIEHHAVLHTLEKLKNDGFKITLLDTDEHGLISPEKLKNAITDDTCLVTIMFANNEIGTIEPIKELSAICNDKGILFHTDAVQAIGHIDIDLKDFNIDLLSLSAHKFHGPKGVGILYAKRGIKLSNIIYGGAQERGKRAGTENLAAIMGMTVALENALTDLDEKLTYTTKLRDSLISGLTEIPHTILNGDKDLRLAGNVNVCFEGIEGESLLLLLDAKGICASSGSACTSGSLDPSHVLLAIGRPHEIAHGSLRLSINEENTMDEIEYIIEKVKETVEYLRAMSPVWRDLKEGRKEYVIQ